MISLLELGVKSSPQLVFHTMVSCIWVRCGLGIHLESVRHGFLGIEYCDLLIIGFALARNTRISVANRGLAV